MISNKKFIVYDLNKFTYGSLIIFLEFLNQYKNLTNKRLTVFLVYKNKYSKDILELLKKSRLSNKQILLKNFNDLFDFYKFNNSKFIQKINCKGFYNFNQNSIIPIQNNFNLRLSKSFKLNLNYKEKFNEYSGGKIRVCVNLNYFNKKKIGSAKIKEWDKFFFKCSSNTNLSFYFIGNNKIPLLKKHKNITFLNDLNVNITQEINFAQNCHFFIGSASGPSTIFLLSSIPYLIFKHPNHHPKTYKRELLGINKPKFSTKNQYLLNIFEDERIILSYFNKIIKGLKI